MKSNFNDKMSTNLYNKRAALYEIAQKAARNNHDNILRIGGMEVRKFTTLPSYNYQLHPEMRDLFIED